MRKKLLLNKRNMSNNMKAKRISETDSGRSHRGKQQRGAKKVRSVDELLGGDGRGGSAKFWEGEDTQARRVDEPIVASRENCEDDDEMMMDEGYENDEDDYHDDEVSAVSAAVAAAASTESTSRQAIYYEHLQAQPPFGQHRHSEDEYDGEEYGDGFNDNFAIYYEVKTNTIGQLCSFWFCTFWYQVDFGLPCLFFWQLKVQDTIVLKKRELKAPCLKSLWFFFC